MLNRQIIAIAPFTPGAEVILHVRVADQTKGEVRVGGPIGTLAVRDYFLIGRDVPLRVHFCKLLSGFEKALRVEIVRPLEMNRSGDRASAL